MLVGMVNLARLTVGRRCIPLVALLLCTSLEAAAQVFKPDPRVPVAYTHIDARSLRLPTPGAAVITDARQWRALWQRYSGGVAQPPTSVPEVDFSTKQLVVVGANAAGCSRDPSVFAVYLLADTISVQSGNAIARLRLCGDSRIATDVIVIDRTSKPIRCFHNATYTQPLPPAPWWERRSLADLDTVADPISRAGWLVELARADTSVANLRRLAEATARVGGASALLAVPQLQRDSLAVYTVMYNGGVWTAEATRNLVDAQGPALVRDPKTSGGTLELMFRYLERLREPSALIAAIHAHPAIAADTLLRNAIVRSGLLPPSTPKTP